MEMNTTLQATMKKVVILGTGGNCTDILDAIRDLANEGGDLECVGFLDDNLDLRGKEIHGVKVIGGLNRARQLDDHYFVNGIGSTNNYFKKAEIIDSAGIPGDRFVNVIHPSASVSDMASLGHGIVVFQNAVVTSNAQIGDHCMLLPTSVTSHDVSLGRATILAGGAVVSGNTSIGLNCYLGANSSVKDGLRIGDRCLIGMGCVVVRDVASNSVLVGNPARLLRTIEI